MANNLIIATIFNHVKQLFEKNTNLMRNVKVKAKI